jgi:hypothetical protein
MLPWASPSQGVRLRLCTGVRPRSSHALPRPGLATEPPAPRSIDQPQPRLVRQPANQLPHKATLTGFSHRNTPERSSESLSGLLGSPRVALCITANRRRSLDSRTALRKSLGCALRCRASRATLSFPIADIWRSTTRVGCRLPDAILCGKQRYRSHSRTVPAFSDRNFLGEAS